jgi:hypothetical protein
MHCWDVREVKHRRTKPAAPGDDVRADLASRPPLTHAQMTQIVDLLNRPITRYRHTAVIVTLRSLVPAAGLRLQSASRPQVTQYLDALKASMIEALAVRQPSADAANDDRGGAARWRDTHLTS